MATTAHLNLKSFKSSVTSFGSVSSRMMTTTTSSRLTAALLGGRRRRRRLTSNKGLACSLLSSRPLRSQHLMCSLLQRPEGTYTNASSSSSSSSSSSFSSISSVDTEEEGKAWENRARKRNVAFFYGYVGTQYMGSMINEVSAPGKTVESVLFKALHDMGGVLSTNFPDPKKVSRRSRTLQVLRGGILILKEKIKNKNSNFFFLF